MSVSSAGRDCNCHETIWRSGYGRFHQSDFEAHILREQKPRETETEIERIESSCNASSSLLIFFSPFLILHRANGIEVDSEYKHMLAARRKNEELKVEQGAKGISEPDTHAIYPAHSLASHCHVTKPQSPNPKPQLRMMYPVFRRNCQLIIVTASHIYHSTVLYCKSCLQYLLFFFLGPPRWCPAKCELAELV